jgi:hypothetical protein
LLHPVHKNGAFCAETGATGYFTKPNVCPEMDAVAGFEGILDERASAEALSRFFELYWRSPCSLKNTRRSALYLLTVFPKEAVSSYVTRPSIWVIFSI